MAYSEPWSSQGGVHLLLGAYGWRQSLNLVRLSSQLEAEESDKPEYRTVDVSDPLSYKQLGVHYLIPSLHL